MNVRLIVTILIASFFGMVAPGYAGRCEDLGTLALATGHVTAAVAVQPGPFTPPTPSPVQQSPSLRNLPAFCRVTASLTPTSDSDIRIEVWLPMSGWNSKLQSVGNGAWGGAIPYPALAAALLGGYAAAATDTGHVGNTAEFVPNHPEKLVDYGYRAVHELTVTSKIIVAKFFGSGPKRAYWNGCSTGGRQGLMEAVRFPTDYDGIIAGAPVNYRTDQLTWELWVAQAVHKDDASYILPAKYATLHNAALAACDARDGLTDGLIDSPQQCRFDPKTLQCPTGDAVSCLTAPQVDAARKIYSGAINPRTKREIFPGLLPGSELAWAALAGPQPAREAVGFFRYVLFNDPTWDFHALTFDTAQDLANAAAGEVLNVTDPDLTAFFNRGGKLLMYHGWGDQLVPPLSSINYYKTLTERMGGSEKVSRSARLFMMPGVNHCQGGEGPDTFDKVDVLDRWVEKMQSPTRIVASHSTEGKIDRTRPLCPFPQVARYTGRGSIDEAANFVCRLP